MPFTYGNKNFGEMPRPGQLREYIRIGRTESGQNDNGYPVSSDIYICRVFAKAENSGYNQTDEAGVSAIAQGRNYSIRWRDDVTVGMWVEYRGQRWQIIDVIDYDGRKRYLGLRTIGVQAVSG